jgi:hypothetical protein
MPALPGLGRCLSVVLATGICLSAFAPTALAQAAAPDSATAEQQAKAQAEYERGVAQYKAHDYAGAARDFEASYKIVASPNSHIMYARSLRASGQDNRAYEELALTQQEASLLAVRLPRYGKTSESAEAEMKDLLPHVAVISLEVSGDPTNVTVSVGGREIPPRRWRAVAVKPGTVQVTARLPGGRRLWHSVPAKLGSITRVRLDFGAEASNLSAPPTPVAPASHSEGAASVGAEVAPPHHLRTWAYVAGGVGAAGLLTFGIAGAMSKSTYSDLEKQCPNNRCPETSQSEIDKGRAEQTAANVGLVLGVLGVGAGVTLFLIDHKQTSQRQALESLRVVAGPAAVGLEGEF